MDFASTFGASLDALYAMFGVDVVLTRKAGGPAVPGRAILNRDSMSALGGEVALVNTTLHYREGAFPDVVRGDVFTTKAGAAYAVREAPQVAIDGQEWFVTLAKA